MDMDIYSQMQSLADFKPRTICGPLSELRSRQDECKIWCLVVIIHRDWVRYDSFVSHKSAQKHVEEQESNSAQVRALHYVRHVLETVEKDVKKPIVEAIKARLDQTQKWIENGVKLPDFRSWISRAEEAFLDEVRLSDEVREVFERIFHCDHAETQFIRRCFEAPADSLEGIKEVAFYLKTSPCPFSEGLEGCSPPEPVRPSRGGLTKLPAGCLDKIRALATEYEEIEWDVYFDNVHGRTDEVQRLGREGMKAAEGLGNLKFWKMGTQLGNQSKTAESVDLSYLEAQAARKAANRRLQESRKRGRE
jgi:hypothetical protein